LSSFQSTRGSLSRFPEIEFSGAHKGGHERLMSGMRNERQIGKVVPTYVCRQTACRELDMSDDTFDKYVREGILPQPKRRGTLMRWKWSEIVAALDGGSTTVIELEQDAFQRGIRLAKEASRRAA
jgi:hypothetical protein